MSITGFSSNHTNKIYKKPSHWRNNSGEIDVFEASKYFSNTITDQNPALNFSNPKSTTPARMSLDMPVMLNPITPPEFHHLDQKQPKLENKKYKQPSSPCGRGRLASFLNSLFNQISLKNKKSKPGKDFDDEDTPGFERRNRRSSISHFRIITSNNSSVDAGDSSRSGFRTPQPYAETHTKPYKYFNDENTPGFGRRQRRSSINHFSINTSSNSGVAAGDNSGSGFRTRQPYADKPTKSYEAISLLPTGKGGSFKTRLQEEMCADKKYKKKGKNNSKNQDFRKFDDGDYGEDSDSSSDLFDLPSHELDFYSSGLPVYETTHMDTIKLVKPIYRANTV